MVEPPLEQCEVCLQVDPSPMPKWNSRVQSNSTDTWKVVTEISFTSEPESHPNDGHFSGSDEAEPAIHWLWNPLVRASKLRLLGLKEFS
jgi:hypothetical protein